jgi:DNA-binding NarL/FixJ family response regulator
VAGNAGVDHVILIVDGDQQFRRFAVRLLAATGFPTRAVARGRQALEVAAEARLALVLLEVRLEDVSGYEICRKLREDHGESLPILFVSYDRTEASDRVAGLLVGADDYLAKPVAPDELLARAHRHLRRLETWNGRGARLTKREREILGLLAEGLGPSQIATDLGITPKTVATHVEHIYSKRGAHARAGRGQRVPSLARRDLASRGRTPTGGSTRSQTSEIARDPKPLGVDAP